jgi:tetratricopeptide (TPR) repeat protein
MMPLVLELGLFYDEIACQLLLGQFENAKVQSLLAVNRAAELVIRFPNELRSNLVLVQARFQHFVCLLHLADYQAIERYLTDWTAELELEDQPSLAAEQKQFLRCMILANLAIAYDWSGDGQLGTRCWESAIEQAPDSLRAALNWLSHVNQTRQTLRANQPVQLNIPNPETAVELAAKAVLDGQVRYPSTYHALAELHCLMIVYWSSHSASTDQRAMERIDYHRQCAIESIEMAAKSGFYDYGNRLEQLDDDPLFEPLRITPEWNQIFGRTSAIATPKK